MSKNSRSHYVSELILKIGDESAPPQLIEDVLEVYIEESLHRPTTFTLRIHNAYLAASKDSEPWRHQEHFKIGDRISIGFAASTTKDPIFQKEVREPSIFEGEITAMEGDFNARSAYIVVQGSDVSHRLHRGRYNRSFENKTDKEIVEKIAKECDIAIGQIDPSERTHDYVFQENQTNMEFLRERAAWIGFELFVQNNQLYFRPPQNNGSLQLKWLNNIESFNVRVDSTQQVSSVEVRGWNYSENKLISATATTEEVITSISATATTKKGGKEKSTTPFNSKGSSNSTAFKNSLPAKMIVVDQPVSNVTEAEKMAQALCNELGGEFVCADAKAEGNPEIRPGKVVELAEMGPYSGKYYVTETRHIYSQGVYRTEFSVRGLREGTLLSTLAPKVPLQPGQTLMVGIVTHNKDDKNLGRVKVKYPTLTEEHCSNWARVVGLGAGNKRGCYWLPEIDDEVLVGFEHGDIHRPYIIGGVWNGEYRTVEEANDTISDDGKVRLRILRTREGHELRFVDDGTLTDWEGVYLTADSGQGLAIDELTKTVALESLGGPNYPLLPPLSSEVSVNPVFGAKVCSPVKVDIETAFFSPWGINMKGSKIDLETTLINLGPQPSKFVGVAKRLRPRKKIEQVPPPPPAPPPPAVAINSTVPLTIAAPTITILAPVIKMVVNSISITGTVNVNGPVAVAGPITSAISVTAPLINGKPI